jgi:hypothetical protein
MVVIPAVLETDWEDCGSRSVQIKYQQHAISKNKPEAAILCSNSSNKRGVSR